MASPAALHRYSFADYLGLEEASNTKHEFLAGEIYGMAGGTPEQAALAVAVSASLLAQLRGRGCTVYSSDLRVRVAATGLATYPDVSVVCGELQKDPESPTTVLNPRVVVEVTSDSTEAYDRGQKLDHYGQIDALVAVVFVSHRRREIEVWERSGNGRFTSREYVAGQLATIDSMSVRLPVDDVYRDIAL